MLDQLMQYALTGYLWLIDQSLMFWIVTGGIAAFLPIVFYAVFAPLPVIPGAPDGKPLFTPLLTRRQGLDKVLKGEWGWDDYVKRFSGQPDDGSLRKEQKRVEAALEKAAHPLVPASLSSGLRKEFAASYADSYRTLGQRIIDNSIKNTAPELLPVVPIETTVLRRCSKTAHEGVRVSKSRLHGRYVWQPRAKEWVTIPGGTVLVEHKCCPGYVWVSLP